MSLSNLQSRPRIPLGMGGMVSGTVTYGGFAVRGAKRMKQYQEQTDGIRPSLSYRGAEYLPAVALDTNMDGAPVVMFAGSVIGVAGIDGLAAAGPGRSSETASTTQHGIALANGGVKVQVKYDSISLNAVENIATLGSVVTQATDASTAFLMANKPIGVASANIYSAATEKLFRNLKLQHEAPYVCDWLVELPVFNIFMNGGTWTVAQSALGLDRSAAGLAKRHIGVNIAGVFQGLAADVNLVGLQAGDIAIVNPYVPGTVISIGDLELIINQDVEMRTNLGSAVVVTNGDAAAPVFGLSSRYIADQTVGKVMKRQAILSMTGELDSNNHLTFTTTARDAYAEGLMRVTTARGFGLSGNDSQGIESHLASAYDFATTLVTGAGVNADVSTVYINLQF